MNEFEINDRISLLIERLDITPYEFSKRMGNKRPDGLYKILKNEAKPTPKTLGKIKEAFSEHYAWLLTGEGDMPGENGNGGIRNGNVTERGDISVKGRGIGPCAALERQLAEKDRQIGLLLAQQEKLIAKLTE